MKSCQAQEVSVDVKGLPWTGIEDSLNSPSNGPLLLSNRNFVLATDATDADLNGSRISF